MYTILNSGYAIKHIRF